MIFINTSRQLMSEQNKKTYPVSKTFVDWLNGGMGRAARFQQQDKALVPAVISKFKHGVLPITFEHAVRLERSQPPSDKPLRAEDLCTYEQDRDLILYLRPAAALQAAA
jgi:hypothetical protein